MTVIISTSASKKVINMFSKLKGTYLNSKDFKNLSKYLNLTDDDVKSIKENCSNPENLDEIGMLIYNAVYKEESRDFAFKGDLIRKLNELYYYAYIIDEEKWEDIKNKLLCEINIGKINSFYYLYKSFFAAFERDEIWTAISTILMKVLNYLLKDYYLPDCEKDYIYKEMINIHRNNPLYVNAIRDDFTECTHTLIYRPVIKLKEYADKDFFIIDSDLFDFLNDLTFKNSDVNDYDLKYIFAYPCYIDFQQYFIFLELVCPDGNGRFYFSEREDFNSYVLIHGDLVSDCFAIRGHFSNEDLEKYYEYRTYSFYNVDFDAIETSSNDFDSFTQITCRNPEDNKEFIFLNPRVKKDEITEDEISEEELNTLSDIVRTRPLSDEFLEILSLLNLDLSYAGQLQRLIKNSDSEEDILNRLNRKVSIKNTSKDILSKEQLNEMLFDYEIKSVLLHCEDSWSEIKNDLQAKIASKMIMSGYNLDFEYENHFLVKKSDKNKIKANLLLSEINALFEFRQADKKQYASQLAYYLRDLDIYSNDLYHYFDKNLNEDYHPMPQSLSEAIDYLIVNGSREFIDEVYEMDKDSLISYHFTLGMWIRNEFGLNTRSNYGLLEDLKFSLNGDSYSSQILDALWDYVQENYEDIIENTQFLNNVDMYKYMM